MLIYVTDLSTAQPALPDFTFVIFSYTGLALFTENHKHSVKSLSVAQTCIVACCWDTLSLSSARSLGEQSQQQYLQPWVWLYNRCQSSQMFLAPNTFLSGTVVCIKNPPVLFPIGWDSGMPGKYMGRPSLICFWKHWWGVWTSRQSQCEITWGTTCLEKVVAHHEMVTEAEWWTWHS